MRKKLEFNASPRPHGNTSYLLEQFRDGAAHHSRHLEVIHPHELNLEHCHGCLQKDWNGTLNRGAMNCRGFIVTRPNCISAPPFKKLRFNLN